MLNRRFVLTSCVSPLYWMNALKKDRGVKP